MNKDQKGDDMAAAAKQLAEEKRKLTAIKVKVMEKNPPNSSDETMFERNEEIERAAFQDPEFIEANQKYEQLYASTAAKYPVLAAFKDDPGAMATIGEKGAGPETATLIAKNLKEKQKNIKETQDNLDGGKLSVWSLPNIVSGTKNKMSLAPNSLEAKFVDEYKSDKETAEMIKKIALAALGAALGIISAVATAGGSLVVAAGAAAGGLTISSAQLMESVQDYQVTSAAANTDLDKAKSVSQSDASLFWVAVDLIAAGMDLAAARAAFKALAGPVHAAMEAKIAAKAAQTAEKAGQETAEAAKFSKTVDELDQAAKGAGVPDKAAAKIKSEVQGELKAQIIDPEKRLAAAGNEGSLAARGKGFGAYEAYIPGVKDKVVVKVFPSDDAAAMATFEQELKGAEAAGKTGIGPKCYGEVSVGEGKRAFAMEKVEGSMVHADEDVIEKAIEDAEKAGDTEKAAKRREELGKATAEAAETASKINQVTIQDVRAYGNRLLDQGFYAKGDLQGLVDGSGHWRPIDFSSNVPLPDKIKEPAAYAEALARHNWQVERQVNELVAAGPKPLPNAPVGTLPPYNLPPKPAQPRRRGQHSLRSADDDDWLAERIGQASGGGQPIEPQAQARLEAGLQADLGEVRIHDDAEAADLAAEVDAVAFTSGRDIFFGPRAQARLEAGLQADLGEVRIHDDAEAADLAAEVDAVAFTSGRDIFFGPGTYQPASSEGLELLAHEAAHTVQQAAGPVDGTLAAGGVMVSDPGDPYEQAAQKMAAAVTSAGAADSTAAEGQALGRRLDADQGDGQSVQRAGLPPEEDELKRPTPDPLSPELAKKKQPDELV